MLGLDAGRASRRPSGCTRSSCPTKQVLRERGDRQSARADAIRDRGPVGAAAGAQAHPELRHLARAAAADDDRQDSTARSRAARARTRADGRRPTRQAAVGRRSRAGSPRPAHAARRVGDRRDGSIAPGDRRRRQSRARSRPRLDGARRAADGARAAAAARASRRRCARRSSRCASSWTPCASAPAAPARRRRRRAPTLAVGRAARGAARSGARREPGAAEGHSRGRALRRCSRSSALAARVVLLGFRVDAAASTFRATARSSSVPNHQAYLDGFFVAAGAALPRRSASCSSSARRSTSRRRSWRWLARAINIVPVDPDANLVSAMRAGAAGLRLKKVLMLFPEGERSIDGELKKFRKGAAILVGASRRADRAGRARRPVSICGRAAGRSTGAACCRGARSRSPSSSAPPVRHRARRLRGRHGRARGRRRANVRSAATRRSTAMRHV